ncbi:Gfo/Idh/MocA family protein [Paenibacillus spongiae]|uniref:Gfo/Idh/MocA family oxidoreductase n=1 Tax=Paenibacillus spongiae TaxID=2909671 RepID=A0ABY5S792_9BACL|nr:Gfo/Idh/MocA family oxidoreductase [Paenibacillus spongiae]UVI29777.1 Gfo/Idh/MocA family oxidoreductase [Paenibacillus spongiae]
MTKIKVGIVGARGLSTLLGFQSCPEAEVVALCDLDEALLKEAALRHHIPNTYRIYEDMLESDIDAVVVSSPMQLHVPQTLAALDAGKHVLSEVTAGVTMDELWWLKDAVEKYGKVYMMAENYCYIPENQLISNMVEQGLFGDVYFGEGEYLHDIKSLAVGYNRPTSGSAGSRTSWRKYWQLGKRGAFYPTHSLGPVMKWFKHDRIKSVTCLGTGWHTAPELRQEDTTITLCQLESGKLIKLRIDCISERPHNMSYYTLQGTKGCYEAPRGLGDQHKIWLASDQAGEHPEWRPLKDYYTYLPDRYKNVTAEQKAAGHWGGDYFIVQDFVDAIAKNAKPAIDVYEACEWTAVGLLSELSVMNGGKSMDMPDFRNSSSYRDQIIKL